MNKLVYLLCKDFLLNPFKIFIELFKYKNGYGFPPFKLLCYRLLLNHIIKIEKPDLIHAHGIIFVPVIQQIHFKRPVIYTFHGMFFIDDTSIQINKTRGIDVRKLYFNSAKFIKNCTYLTNEMAEVGRSTLKIIAKDKIISNGIDTDKFLYCEKNREKVRNENGADINTVIFITVASLNMRKNQIGFINYIKNLTIDYQYWIIGAGEQEEKIKLMIREMNLEHKIKTFSYIPNTHLYAYYSAADIYAHPSTAEGQALCVLEALAIGLKVMVNKKIQDTLNLTKQLTKDEITVIDLKKPIEDSHQIFSSLNKQRTTANKRISTNYNWVKIANEYKSFFFEISKE